MIRAIATAIALTIAVSFGAAPAAASPGIFTVSGAGGYDDQTRNIWSGVEVALHPNNVKGFGLIANVTPNFGFTEKRPMGFAELGLVHFIQAERAIVRVGLVGRMALLSVPYRVAIKLGQIEENRIGLIPTGMLHVEFQYGTESPFIFGLRAGMGSSLSNFRCTDPTDLSDCALWADTVVANAFGNMRLKNGLFIELMLGHNSKLSVGYAF